jgi:hypothetical protein
MPKTLKTLTIISVGGAGWRATRLSTFSTPFSLYGRLWKPRHLAPPRALSNPQGRRSVAQGRTDRADTGEPHHAIADTATFIPEWGAQAEALGWTVQELLGLYPVPANPRPSFQRLARYDATGLIWLLRGRPVIALSETEAAIQSAGAVLQYRKNNKPGLGPLGDSLDDFGAVT